MDTTGRVDRPRTVRGAACLAGLVLGSAGGLHAQLIITVDYLAGPGLRYAVDSGSTYVADGNSVWVGTFQSGFDVAANVGQLSLLRGAWLDFGSTTVRTIQGEPGRFSATAFQAADSFQDQKIYLWLFKTSDNQAPASDSANVLEYGLYSSPASNWVFPRGDALPPLNLTTVTSSDVSQAYYGGYTGGALTLAAVPEPRYGALAIGVLLLTWTLARRRPPIAGPPCP